MGWVSGVGQVNQDVDATASATAMYRPSLPRLTHAANVPNGTPGPRRPTQPARHR